MIEKLKQQLVEHEGLRLKPYRCTAGKLTIGVGRNLDDRGITNVEAMVLLNNDILLVVNDLKRNLPWFEAAPETVQIVLADMCFNMGINRLLQFKKTLLHLERKEYVNAALEMLNSNWAVQVGKRAAKLSVMIRSLA